MMFSISSPFIYMTHLKLSVNEYAIFMFIPMLVNIVSSYTYKSIVVIYGLHRCIIAGIVATTFLVPFYIAIGFEWISVHKYTILLAMCLQTAVIPLIVPGFSAKTIDLYPTIKGLCSSASASVRSMCGSILMLFSSGVIGNDVHSIFFAQGVIIIAVMLLYIFSTRLVNNF